MKMYYESDIDKELIKSKKIAVLGYGSQGHAHSLNLKDSGFDVVVGLYEGSKSKQKAEEKGLTVLSNSEAVKSADFIQAMKQLNISSKENVILKLPTSLQN